jgi:hypothetical protein
MLSIILAVPATGGPAVKRDPPLDDLTYTLPAQRNALPSGLHRAVQTPAAETHALRALQSVEFHEIFAANGCRAATGATRLRCRAEVWWLVTGVWQQPARSGFRSTYSCTLAAPLHRTISPP